ncbi:MAG TPA: hypothetical protein VGI19_05235, partial [Candidatus Cybelea sp.]
MIVRCCLLLALLGVVPKAPSGDEILALAGASDGFSSYSAPVQFDVSMHKPLSVHSAAQGTVYYKAPSTAVLAITTMPAILRRFFKSSYAIDLAPQVWPAKYRVRSVSEAKQNDTDVYLLQAVPVADPSVSRVEFGVTQS